MSTSLPIRPSPGNAQQAIPSELWGIYKSYKRNTGYVLDWLRINAAENVANQESSKSPISDHMSMKEILRASQIISKRKLTPPQYIRTAFNHVLLRRKQVNEWYCEFGSQDAGTVAANESHGVFNDALAEAYTTIFPTAADGRKRGEKPRQNSVPKNDANSKGTFYDILMTIKEQEPDSLVHYPADEPQVPNIPASTEYSIVDDPLADILDGYMFVFNLDSICGTVKSYWTLAKEGSIPITFAAWLTCAGFAHAQRLSRAIDKIGGYRRLINYALTISELQLYGLDVTKAENTSRGSDTIYQHFSNGQGLIQPGEILKHFKSDLQHHKEYMQEVRRVPISKYFPSPSQVRAIEENYWNLIGSKIPDALKSELPKQMQEGIFQHFANRLGDDRPPMQTALRSLKQVGDSMSSDSLLSREGWQALLPELKVYLRSSDTYPTTSLVFGLQLLVETCKSFVWKDDSTPNPVNCRMQALRFVQEIKESVDEVAKRREVTADNMTAENVLAMGGMSYRMQEYLQEKRLDLCYQTPWVAGQHMVLALCLAQSNGVALWNQRGIVGTVLHAYNMVNQVTNRPIQNPVLDALSKMLCEAVFLDTTPPTSRFDVVWKRYMGGSIVKKAYRGPKDKKFTIELVEPPVDGDVKSRIFPRDLSLFHELCGTQFIGGREFWVPVLSNRQKKTATNSELNRMEASMRERPSGYSLDRMKKVVSSEFEDGFPFARINYFKVYLFFVDIIEEVRKGALEHPPNEFELLRHIGIIHRDTDVFDGYSVIAATIHQVSNPGPKDGEVGHSCLTIIREAVERCFEGKKLEDFLWKNL